MSSDTLQCAFSGMFAGTLQTGSLLWLRTINKNQYKYGSQFAPTMRILYNDGNIPRFFRGFTPAIIDNALCRFGDAYIYCYINKHYSDLSLHKKSTLMSLLTTPHKMLLTPLDMISVNYHIYGKNGGNVIKNTIKKNGILTLYTGGSQILFLNIFSNYIWFTTFLYLEGIHQHYKSSHTLNAIHGFIPTIISDIFTNPFRMIKTYKQSSPELSYKECIRELVNNNYSMSNILFRGLSSRMLIHGIQTSVYVVLWKSLLK